MIFFFWLLFTFGRRLGGSGLCMIVQGIFVSVGRSVDLAGETGVKILGGNFTRLMIWSR